MPQSFKPFPPKRRFASTRPLADLVAPCIGTVLGKHGFGEADVLMHWPEIVGAGLAERCQPLKLQWRSKGTAAEARHEPATLVIRVESAFAVHLQHMGSVIIDKVNTYLGWRCIGQIALRQGPLPPLTRKPPPPARPDPAALAKAGQVVGNVEDAGLREALTRLGGRVLHGTRPLTRPPRI